MMIIIGLTPAPSALSNALGVVYCTSIGILITKTKNQPKFAIKYFLSTRPKRPTFLVVHINRFSTIKILLDIKFSATDQKS
uniref:Uncharacterized protein n=1 Tax=Rhizophagus irregularis (strain DAOM 181602 / DAOM 197198 / MUCL 43194) TaxID=747089 RepID=U9TDW0_RHIID